MAFNGIKVNILREENSRHN